MSVRDSEVTQHEQVPTREARRRAEDVAFEVTGVRHVTDCQLRARLESVEEAAASAAPAADAAVESEGVRAAAPDAARDVAARAPTCARSRRCRRRSVASPLRSLVFTRHLQRLASFRLKVAAVAGNVVRDPVRERASRRIRIVDDQREASGPLWWLGNVQLRNCVAAITGESGRHRVAVSKCRTGYGECHRILVCTPPMQEP